MQLFQIKTNGRHLGQCQQRSLQSGSKQATLHHYHPTLQLQGIGQQFIQAMPGAAYILGGLVLLWDSAITAQLCLHRKYEWCTTMRQGRSCILGWVKSRAVYNVFDPSASTDGGLEQRLKLTVTYMSPSAIDAPCLIITARQWCITASTVCNK